LGWFKNENTWKFVSWAFSKCSNQSYSTVYDNCEITLQPYECICGRNKSSAECFLTPKQFRGQLILLCNEGILKKGANSKANRYTSYVWVTERFSNNKGQLQGQIRANSGPTQGHNLEDKKIKTYKKDHPSIPSFEKKGSDDLNDDLFSKEEEKDKIHIFSGQYITTKKECHVYLSQQEIEDCIRAHGSKENMLNIIKQIVNWPGRLYVIKEWSKTIMNWKYKNTLADRIKENETIGKRAET